MNEKTCPTCHVPVPADAPGGFCPACLLRDADEPEARPTETAPPLEEISAAFPQWEVLGFIGQGGMGSVYQVRQPGLDRVAALKILSPALGRDPAFAERFAREARVLGRLNHPNIVTIFEHGESGGFFYLLMEHVDGVNLRQAMRAGRFTPEQALAIVPGICDALQAAHAQGVWHRDIKPENILLDEHGGVKIADFGIARMAGDREWNFTLTRTGGALGSAAYMAPEQHENPRGVDHRADIYSLGVVIYEMLTGELPIGRFPALSRRAAVNAKIDEIVFRTLEKERELRQQSAAEVKTEMQGVRNPAPAAVPTPAPTEQARNSLIIVLLACMAGYTAWAFLTGVKVIVFLGGIGILSSLVLGMLTWRTWSGRVATLLWALAVLAVPAYVVITPMITDVESAPPLAKRTPKNIVPSPQLGNPQSQVLPSRRSPARTPSAEPKTQNVDTIVDWNIFLPANGNEPATTRNVKGKLNAGLVTGAEYSAVAVFAGEGDWTPLCTIVSKGSVSGIESRTDGKGLRGCAVLRSGKIEYAIREPDNIVIGNSMWDLRQGRVFLCRPDGSVRQIALSPRQLIPDNEIDDFAAALPKEQFSWQQAVTPPSGNASTGEAPDQAGVLWAKHRKEGDVHFARGDLAAALTSYQAARDDVSRVRKADPGTELKEQQADCEDRIGDVMYRRGNLQETMSAYLLSAACLQRVLEKEPKNDRVRDKLVRMLVKMGDYSNGEQVRPTAVERYRQAVVVAEKLEDGWETAYPLNMGGEEIARNYQPETVFNQMDKPDRDSWDLMWMIGQAGANKDNRLLPLLERKELLEDESLALALAGYDYSLNGNPDALEFILTRLATKRVAKDVNEVVVLSFIDEWERSTKAVDSHFIFSPSEGGPSQNAFWARRKLLFPRNYLVHLGKVGKETLLPVPGKSVSQADGGRNSISQWQITEDFTPGEQPQVIHLQGKLTPEAKNSENHAMFTVHIDHNPVFMIVCAGSSTGQSNSTSGRELKGSFRMNQPISYRIDDGDRATIEGHAYDLTKGRVFLVRPGNTLRQIAMRPQRMIPVEALEKFVTGLPSEK